MNTHTNKQQEESIDLREFCEKHELQSCHFSYNREDETYVAEFTPVRTPKLVKHIVASRWWLTRALTRGTDSEPMLMQIFKTWALKEYTKYIAKQH